MASYNIQSNSVKMIDGEKVSMTVTFKASNGSTKTCYHEVDSIDPDEIENCLKSSAKEYERSVLEQEDMNVTLNGIKSEITIGQDVTAI